MKDPLLSGKLWKDRDRPCHLVFQILILSQLNSDISIQKTDLIIIIKQDMIRNHIILGKDRRKRDRRIHNSFLDGKFLFHHHFSDLDTIKESHLCISRFTAFYKIAVTVKINITVQIWNAPDNIFFFHTDDQLASARTSDIKVLNVRKILCCILCIKQRCQHGVGCHRTFQYPLFQFVIGIMVISHDLYRLYLKKGKEKNNGSQNCDCRTAND